MKVSCQVHKPIVVCLVFLGISQQFCKTGHNWSNGPFSEVGSIWCMVKTVLSNLSNFLKICSWSSFLYLSFTIQIQIFRWRFKVRIYWLQQTCFVVNCYLTAYLRWNWQTLKWYAELVIVLCLLKLRSLKDKVSK